MTSNAAYSDHDLAKALDALSNPVRLAILRSLEQPKALSKIGISSGALRGSTLRGEILARQTVKQHLDRLANAGLVVANRVPRRRGETTEYSIDPNALVGIAEAFHHMAHVFTRKGPAPAIVGV